MTEATRRNIPVRAAVRRKDEALLHSEWMPVGEINGQTDWSKALINVTHVLHLAAHAHVSREPTGESLVAIRATNTEGTINLAAQAAKAGVSRFVFASTIKVNGEGRQSPYSEIDVPAPADAYAVSKSEAEQGLRDIAANAGMEIVLLRFPLVYGPGVGANFLQLMKALDAGWPLPMRRICNRRSFIYLGNLIDAMNISLTHSGAANRLLLVSDCDDLSTTELVQRLAHALNAKPRLFYFPSTWLRWAAIALNKNRVFDQLWGSLLMDCSAIRRDLSWLPPFSVDQGLAETAKWYRHVFGGK